MKKALNIFIRVFIILVVVLVLIVACAAGYFYYTRWSKDQEEIVIVSGDKVTVQSTKIVLEPSITCLFLGVNGSLTDFIVLGKYDPNTRQVNLLSIPRDTYIETGGIDHKINSAYAKGGTKNGFKAENTMAVVEELTGVKIDYYVVFNTKVLREIVDAIGGVEVDVPINMNYDDPYQSLYIHLNKGHQLLDGKKAEQFVRFRKNNNGTGYPDGDIGRIKTQQQFLQAMLQRCLEPQNLLKATQLINIVLDNTKTNITDNVIGNYIDDAIAFKTDRVRMETLPGEGKYIGSISYFVHDEDATEDLVDELFFHESTEEDVKQMMLEEMGFSGEILSGEEITSTVRTELDLNNITVEVLNGGTKASYFNTVVEKLNEAGYKVVRVGNTSSDTRTSTIKVHVSSEEALQKTQDISTLVGINKSETDYYSNSEVDYTIVLGTRYSL